MNCDYVFECLTRGPFPSGGDDDAAIEKHLHACHECRQLAGALQPAVGLFHEALTNQESVGLPRYEGDAGCVAIEPLMIKPTPAATSPIGKRSVSNIIPFAIVACLCAVAFCYMLVEPAKNPSQQEPHNATVVSAEAMVQLAALELPQACLVASGSMENTHCCTQCHNAALQDRAQIAKVTQLASSCLICHTR
ncbi:MAG: hypothetical protein NXI22_17740 [bacterium]|nr:hypothetical protein [bacterium]